MTESRSSSVRWRALSRSRFRLGLAFRNYFTICFLVVLSRCCSNFNRSMLALRDFDGVLSADGGAAAGRVIGRPSSPVTVLVVAPVGGVTASCCGDLRSTRFPL